MKNQFFYRKVVFGLLTLVMYFGSSTGISYGQAVVSVEPTEVESLAAGEELIVSINITGGAGVAGYQVTVNFDPTALRYISGGNADYLPAGAFATPVAATDNSVTIAATSLTGAAPDADGTLATVTFEVVAAKVSTISLSNVTLADATANALEVIAVDGMVTVAADVYALMVGAGDYDEVYAVGETVTASFFAEAIDSEPAAGVQLTITYNGLTGVTISNGGVTDVSGRVSVTGVITSASDVYIQAESEDRALTARGVFRVDLPPARTERVFNKYRETFLRPDVHQLFPDVLRAFQSPEIQEVLSPAMLRVLLQNPRFIQSLVPDVDDSIIVLLAIDEEFRALFRDEDFHAVLMDLSEIDKLIALIEGLTPNPIDIDCPPLLEPPRVATLSIVSGYAQEGQPGSRLSHQFVVEVKDQYGEVFSGVNVTFSVIQGGGSVSPATVQSDNLGRAQTTLTFGSNAGVNVVEAKVAGISRPQIFTATAIAPVEPPIPTTLEIVSGNDQTGESSMPPGTTLYCGSKGSKRQRTCEC